MDIRVDPSPPTFRRHLAATPADVPAGAPLGDVPGGWTVLSTLGANTVTLRSRGVLPAGSGPVLWQLDSTSWTDGGGAVDVASWLLDLGTVALPHVWLFGEVAISGYGTTSAGELVTAATDLSGQRLAVTLVGPASFAGLLTGTFAFSLYTSIAGGRLT